MPELLEDSERQRIYRRVFASGALGPRVLGDLMSYAMVLDAGMEPDPRGQDFMAGRRDVVLYILDCMGITQDYEAIARALAKTRVKPPQPKPQTAEGDE
ncbi:MAG: hypothetical protein JRJ78_17105 [Deltaproteobacteria bacterium]|nr:hypothetical protein [Deltaproteobacteria bacterium]